MSRLTGCNCGKYDNCVIVDSHGYYVQFPDGSNYTFHDDFSIDVFAVTKCDGTNMSAPNDICKTVKKIEPVVPDCSYHLKVDGESSIEYYVVTNMMPVTSQFFAAKHMKMVSEDQTVVLRCDEKTQGGQCYTKVSTGDECNDDSWRNPWEGLPVFPSPALYDSAYFPQDVKCPDGSDGCSKYCEDISGFKCIIVDPAGHFVNVTSGPASTEIWTFYDPPSMDVFEVVKCDGSTTIPAPSDVCAFAKTFIPKYPDCFFNITIERMQITFNFYAIIADGQPIAFKIENTGMNQTFRCDVFGGGLCYMKIIQDSCYDEFRETNTFYEVLGQILPGQFMYNSKEYPLDAKCPDGADGCKQYCDFNAYDCYIVDSAGFVLQDSGIVNFTYSDELSFDVFDVYTCDNSAHFSAPSASSSSPSSSDHPTPTPTPGPSSNPALSSASIVKSAFTFVAIAVALALFQSPFISRVG